MAAVMNTTPSRRFGHAWVSLTIVLALHVLDEALTDFLSVYNPIVRAARARLGWFPMPEFTFDAWLTGLCVVVVVLLALSPLAYGGSPVLRVVSYPYAAIMFLNGVAHLLGSVYLGRWAPGATTAPLLIVASLRLLARARALLTVSAILACAGLVACGSGGPASPSGSTLAGQWSGTTAHGMPIAFTVSSGEKVTAISLGYSFNGCSGSHAFSDLNLDTVPNVTCIPGPCSPILSSFRSFNYSAGSAGGSFTTINGIFPSANRAEGAIAFRDYPQCGSMVGVGWTATRR